MTPSRGSSWLLPLARGRDPRLRLVGFAHCGGGPTLFGGWSRQLPPGIDVWAAALPGRERRSAEPCERSWPPIIEGIVEALAEDDLPAVLFGHSLGALLAFEVAHALDGRGIPLRALFVSACAAPQGQAQRREPIHTLDDERFLDAVRAYGGLPDELLELPEMRTAILPPLRADFALLDAYRYRPAPPLATPIVAFGGTADPIVPVRDLEDWRRQTSRRFALNLLPGDHFYLKTSHHFFRALTRELRELG